MSAGIEVLSASGFERGSNGNEGSSENLGERVFLSGWLTERGNMLWSRKKFI